jgi:hypothetical protein
MNNGHRFHRCLLGLVVVTALSACTSTRVQRVASNHLANTATSYNMAIERAQDEMLLLNVIRAQDNYPLYITDITKVTGTVKADISLGLRIPLVHAGSANDYVATPTVDYSSSPSMDVNLLAAKDFMAGFLTPIPPDVFAYYWNQGWCSELLLYLLVLRVDEYDNSEFKKAYYNQPDVRTEKELEEFSGWVYNQVGKGRPVLCKEADSAVGPPFREDDLEALKFLVPVAKEGLSLRPASTNVKSKPAPSAGKWQLTQPNKAVSLLPYGKNCPAIGNADAAVPSKKDPVTATNSEGIKYVLTLRSPEGVLYYLGQLAKMENKGEKRRALLIHYCEYGPNNLNNQNKKEEWQPLFVALDKKEHEPCPPIIGVQSLDNADYLIPKGDEFTELKAESTLKLADASKKLCATGQTMHALALLSQLISLQKSAKDLTTTSTVKVVGQ